MRLLQENNLKREQSLDRSSCKNWSGGGGGGAKLNKFFKKILV
jgi:hypothetical protein